jgi:hypothetical protein
MELALGLSLAYGLALGGGQVPPCGLQFPTQPHLFCRMAPPSLQCPESQMLRTTTQKRENEQVSHVAFLKMCGLDETCRGLTVGSPDLSIYSPHWLMGSYTDRSGNETFLWRSCVTILFSQMCWEISSSDWRDHDSFFTALAKSSQGQAQWWQQGLLHTAWQAGVGTDVLAQVGVSMASWD